MERSLLFAVLSVLTAFVFAALVFWVAGAVLRRRKAALAAQGEKLSVSNLALWRLRNGYAFLAPLAQVVLKWEKAGDVVDETVYFQNSAVNAFSVLEDAVFQNFKYHIAD